MSKIKAILFDFDGVIVNTEPLYDEYMTEVEKRYNLGIENFAYKIKGTPTPDILQRYFSHLGEDEIKKFEEKLLQFEINMDFPPIAGAINFIFQLKKEGYKVGLVTSSQQVKMNKALSKLNLVGVFDTEVTADRITRGKPDPMCFLLAAQDLGVAANECVVFEDSIHGINAARNANMRVIGLTTSFPEEQIADMVSATLSDFREVKPEIYT